MSDNTPSQFKDITQLYGCHEGEDIYIIGTGASLRVFPTGFFQGKITIGLNMAWKSVPVRYGITIHPELNIPEFMDGEDARPGMTWITKHSKAQGNLSPEHFRYAETNFYFFETDGKPNTQIPPAPSDAGRMVEWLHTPTPGKLYLYGSVAGTGVNLAANMGARNIILVGCDNCALGNNHHSHQQHTRWLHAAPAQRYREYAEALREVRATLRQRNINLLSLTPFMGLGEIEGDFVHLCNELDRPLLLSGQDISPPPASHRSSPVKRTLKKMWLRFLGGGASG